jgi:hypothetical protein
MLLSPDSHQVHGGRVPRECRRQRAVCSDRYVEVITSPRGFCKMA